MRPTTHDAARHRYKHPMTDSPSAWLDGKAILIVEDETIIAMLIEDMLDELGCKDVLKAGNIAEALASLDKQTPDAAILDANLSGEFAFPVATRLVQANVPFVFATGYGRSGIPNEWAARPVVQKPFTIERLEAALRPLFA